MTQRSNLRDEAILSQLREDASASAPSAARERVAARLFAAGIGVLGASTATAGAAAAAAASTGAGAAAGGGMAALSTLGLAKMFFAGMALGVGFGIGAHATLGAERKVGAVPAAPRPAAETRAASQPVPAPSATAPAVPEERIKNLLPEPPSREPAFVSKTQSLAQEQSLLDEARGALRDGDAERALRTTQAHRARFSKTSFDEERRALEIRALLALGRSEDARTGLESFERRFGQSLQLSTLRHLLSNAPAPLGAVTIRAPRINR